MKLLEILGIYIVGFISTILNVIVIGYAMKSIWSYGLNEVTGYSMTLSAAFLISMFIMFMYNTFRYKENDKKYTDFEEILLVLFSREIALISGTLISWLYVWLMTLILI